MPALVAPLEYGRRTARVFGSTGRRHIDGGDEVQVYDASGVSVGIDVRQLASSIQDLTVDRPGCRVVMGSREGAALVAAGYLDKVVAVGGNCCEFAPTTVFLSNVRTICVMNDAELVAFVADDPR
jgi:hypothetical protein